MTRRCGPIAHQPQSDDDEMTVRFRDRADVHISNREYPQREYDLEFIDKDYLLQQNKIDPEIKHQANNFHGDRSPALKPSSKQNNDSLIASEQDAELNLLHERFLHYLNRSVLTDSEEAEDASLEPEAAKTDRQNSLHVGHSM